MKLFISPNLKDYKDKIAGCIKLLEDKFHHECYLNKEDYEVIYEKKCPYDFDINQADLIVSLGGDGTLIRASILSLQYDKALLGINIGRLGYLCALSIDELKETTKWPELNLSKRSLLAIEYNNQKHHAINDIIVGKNNFGNIVVLKAKVENEEMKIRGDGLIISTPTGSTSYNYSANGPIISSLAKVFVLTPICAHFSNNHSMVIDENSAIDIEVINPESNKASIYVDGVDLGLLDKTIRIEKDEKELLLMCRKTGLVILEDKVI